MRISCDDFGTGNNSLTRLQQLPLSELKIDRSFVTGIVDDPRKQAIVKAIVDLGKAFRLDVVAEGIERWEEQTCVFTLGVETGQGYHLCKPVAPTLIRDVMHRNHTTHGKQAG